MIGSIFNSAQKSSNRPKEEELPSLGRRDSSAFNGKSQKPAQKEAHSSSVLRFQEQINQTIERNSKRNANSFKRPGQSIFNDQSQSTNKLQFNRPLPPRSNFMGTESDRYQMEAQSTFNQGVPFQRRGLHANSNFVSNNPPNILDNGRQRRPLLGHLGGQSNTFARPGQRDFLGSLYPLNWVMPKKNIITSNVEANQINPEQRPRRIEDKVDQMFSMGEYDSTRPVRHLPLTSIHPTRPLGPQLVAPLEHPLPFATQPQTYQVKMLRSLIETVDSEYVFLEKSKFGFPEPIKKAIKEATERGLGHTLVDLAEFQSQAVYIRNRVWMWNCQSSAVGHLELGSTVSDVQLLKIMGKVVFLWVEMGTQEAKIVQVSRSEIEEDSLDLRPLMLRQKSLLAIAWKWVEHINGIVFVDSSKQVGTAVFDEHQNRMMIRRYPNPSTSSYGKLKRVKKTLANFLTWKKYFDYKIKIQDDQVFILKSSFQKCSDGRLIELDNPVHPRTGNLPPQKVRVRSQSIYSYCMTPEGSLICNGKLSLKKLFAANKIMLDSHFLAAGGFDTSLRAVDIRIQKMPRSELLRRSVKGKPSAMDVLQVTRDLNQHLMDLSNSLHVSESTQVSTSVVMLMDGGLELQVFPFEGIISRIESLDIDKPKDSCEFLGYVDQGEVVLQQDQSIFLITRSNYKGMSSLEVPQNQGNLVRLCKKSARLRIRDLRACWSSPKIRGLHVDYHSPATQFGHHKTSFLAQSLTSSDSESVSRLFPEVLAPSMISISGPAREFSLVRVLGVGDYLLSLLWLLALEPIDSPCLSEFFVYLARLVDLFGLEEVLRSALCFFLLNDLKKSHVSIRYDWISLLINAAGSSLVELKGSEALRLDQLRNDNMKLLNLKGLLLSVMKVFGGMDSALSQEASRAFFNDMTRWKMGLVGGKQKSLTFTDLAKPSVPVNQPFGPGQLNICFLKKICFELEELSQRKLVIREKIPVKFYNQRVNREEAKIESEARGIIHFMMRGSRAQSIIASLDRRIKEYCGNALDDLPFFGKTSKRALGHEYRLNVGLAEMKDLLGKVVNLRKVLKSLKESWIKQKSLTFTKKMLETLSRDSPAGRSRVLLFVEQFASKENLRGLERIEIICKMLVNLLIVDSLSPKFMSQLVSAFEDWEVRDCLLSPSKDPFFRQLCFQLGNKFFFDKDAIYKFFLDEEVCSCLKSLEVTLLELKRVQKSTLGRRYEERQVERGRPSRRATPSGKQRGQSARPNRVEEQGYEMGSKSLDQMLKTNEGEVRGILDKLDVENLLMIGRVFLMRGRVQDGLRFVELLCHKFESVEREERAIQKVSREKVEQMKAAKLSQANKVVELSALKLEHLKAQKEELKTYLVSVVVHVQARRIKFEKERRLQESTWENLLHWAKTSVKKWIPWSKQEEQSNPTELFLDQLDDVELKNFWEGFLRGILGQSNEEIRVCMLRSILSLGESKTLRNMKPFLRRDDLIRLVDEDMCFKGNIGVQNYSFLINFFYHKKEFKIAIKLILNLCDNNYIKAQEQELFKIKPKEHESWFKNVTQENKNTNPELKDDLVALEKQGLIGIKEKLSFLGRARIMVKKLKLEENKKSMVRRVRTSMDCLELQDRVLTEFGDLESKLLEVRSLDSLLKIDVELVDKCLEMYQFVSFKLNYGNHGYQILLNEIIKPFYLFASFDFYLKNTSIQESFFYENYFKNIQLGMQHFSLADSTSNCFKLSNFFPAFSENQSFLKNNPNPEQIKHKVTNNLVNFLSILSHKNLIFPYNIYPPFLETATNLFFISADELVNLRFRVNNKTLFDCDLKLGNEEEVLNTDHSSRRDRANIGRTLHVHRTELIGSLQNANARNLLLEALMDSKNSHNLMQEGVKQQPFWFTDHLLDNLPEKCKVYDLFNVFYDVWFEMEKKSKSYAQENEIISALKAKEYSRIQWTLTMIVEYMLDLQNKKLKDLNISLTQEDKNKIRNELEKFKFIQEKVGRILSSIKRGPQQINLLLQGNEDLIIFASKLEEDLRKFNLNVKRRRIYF